MKKATPEERYQNPCNDSEYWEMYKISENERMNDWIKSSFDPKKECDVDAYHDTLRDALQEIGERVRLDVQIGGIGAYYVDDKFNYYLVNWTENPWQVKKDMTVQSNG